MISPFVCFLIKTKISQWYKPHCALERNSLCIVKGLLVCSCPVTFGEDTYTSHARTLANIFVFFFSRLLIFGEPPETGFHLPSLFMAGIGRNMFLYHLYWTLQLISFSNFIPVRKPNVYQGNKLMTMPSIKKSSKQQLHDL